MISKRVTQILTTSIQIMINNSNNVYVILCYILLKLGNRIFRYSNYKSNINPLL